ncbi:hypothetical protein D3C79_1045230 [compost metagenome]
MILVEQKLLSVFPVIMEGGMLDLDGSVQDAVFGLQHFVNGQNNAVGLNVGTNEHMRSQGVVVGGNSP